MSQAEKKETHKEDYRDLLKREFETRSTRNSGYSLRAFARDLGLSPSSISLIFSHEQGLSRFAAERLCRNLGLNADETAYFCDSVESLHARSAKERELARIRLNKRDRAETTFQLDLFRVMADWYHFAILELTAVEGFESSSAWISNALGISEKVVELAIERLKKIEMIEEVDGRLRQTVGFMATPSGIPSEALKKFHQQILKKAEEALFLQPIEQRDFSAIVFPMSASDMPWAQARLKEFRREFTARLEQSPTKDRVSCLSIQLFGLQRSPENRNENRPGNRNEK